MKGESAENYCRAFSKLFYHIHKVTGQQISWLHIHGHGIGSITSDMDPGQAKGIKYL